MSISGRAMKITTNTLQEMKQAGEKITMLTAYDFSMARILDRAGIDPSIASSVFVLTLTDLLGCFLLLWLASHLLL